MKDLLNAINDRVRSPFYWAFTFSWLIINWRILIIVFQYKESGCRCGIIQCIKNVASIEYVLVYPLFGALIYIFIVGGIDILITKFTEWAKSKKTEIKFSSDKVVSAEYILRKHEEIELEKKEFKKVRESFEEIISSAKKRNSDLENSIKNFEKDRNSLADSLQIATKKVDWYSKRNDLGTHMNGDWSLEIQKSPGSAFEKDGLIYFSNNSIGKRLSDNGGQGFINILWFENYDNLLRVIGFNSANKSWVYWELHHKSSYVYEGYQTNLTSSNSIDEVKKEKIRITSQLNLVL